MKVALVLEMLSSGWSSYDGAYSNDVFADAKKSRQVREGKLSVLVESNQRCFLSSQRLKCKRFQFKALVCQHSSNQTLFGAS